MRSGGKFWELVSREETALHGEQGVQILQRAAVEDLDFDYFRWVTTQGSYAYQVMFWRISEPDLDPFVEEALEFLDGFEILDSD